MKNKKRIWTKIKMRFGSNKKNKGTIIMRGSFAIIISLIIATFVAFLIFSLNQGGCSCESEDLLSFNDHNNFEDFNDSVSVNFDETFYEFKYSVCFNHKKLINEDCFEVRIADTDSERTQGLMNSTLKENQGMLFIFTDEDLRYFWMKNMLIPLDFVWINSKGNIANFHQNVLPCREEPCEIIYSNVAAKYVLEIPKGSIKNKNITIGQKMYLFKNK